MFGYACDETPELMPLPIALRAPAGPQARRRSASDGTLPYLRPDGKSQVTVEYEDGKPVRIDTVVVSTQHATDIDLEKMLEADITRGGHHAGAPSELDIDTKTKYSVNPTGRFVIGGPMGDAGLTGRKIIVDTYGGMARHGGGAFSGKDPSKVDRSAAYACATSRRTSSPRAWPSRCEVQVAYAIGVAEPGRRDRRDLRHRQGRPGEDRRSAIHEVFDLRPGRDHRATSTCCARSTSRPRRTATSAATTWSSPGSAPTAPTR